MEKLIRKAAALRDAKILVGTSSLSCAGVPDLQQEAVRRPRTPWIKPYINVPIKQMAPFLRGSSSRNLYPEPAPRRKACTTRSIGRSGGVCGQEPNIAALLARRTKVAQKAIGEGTSLLDRPARRGALEAPVSCGDAAAGTG